MTILENINTELKDIESLPEPTDSVAWSKIFYNTEYGKEYRGVEASWIDQNNWVKAGQSAFYPDKVGKVKFRLDNNRK